MHCTVVNVSALSFNISLLQDSECETINSYSCFRREQKSTSPLSQTMSFCIFVLMPSSRDAERVRSISLVGDFFTRFATLRRISCLQNKA
jgi:hypothetical protein